MTTINFASTESLCDTLREERLMPYGFVKMMRLVAALMSARLVFVYEMTEIEQGRTNK